MILRLAHVVIAVDDLEKAREFYVDLLGFVEHARDGDALYLRGIEEFDSWSLGIVERGSAGLLHSAFRVSDPADLDRLAALHNGLSARSVRLPAGAEPGQGEALRVLTPDGHVVEFVHELEEVDPYDADGLIRLPMRNTHSNAGVPPARIDHVSLRVPAVPESLPYWVDALDFSVSEFWLNEDEVPHIAWVRRTTTTHDVALGTNGEPAFHHFAYAVADPNALLHAADLLGDARIPLQLEWGPARHGATNAFAMYIRDPAGNRLELFNGDYVRDLDRPPLYWRPGNYEVQGHSWWAYPPPPSFAESNPLFRDGFES
jgi:3,4-dihydroxyphenylacetate 2,3-dioxygenase